MTEPVPLLTVGDLKSELSRWSDDTPVTFRSPLKEQDYRFYRCRPGDNVLVLAGVSFCLTGRSPDRAPSVPFAQCAS